MKKIKYVLIALAVFVIDMCFKNRIEKRADLQGNNVDAGRFIILRRHHNRGLPFNLAEGHQQKIAAASLIAAMIMEIYFYYALFKADSALLKTGLSLQLGGSYSNTYDRLKRKYVVDYFSFNIPKLKNIVFNLGDIAIFAGSFLVIINAFRKKK